MNDNMDDDVKNILALLQQGTVEEKQDVKKTEKKVGIKKSSETIKADTSSVPIEKKEKKILSEIKPKSTFLAEINEPDDKSVYNSKVLIREEIYEIFMSLKRIKKFKSVSTLVDFALEEYIKNNRENIKKTLYDSKNHEIL